MTAFSVSIRITGAEKEAVTAQRARVVCLTKGHSFVSLHALAEVEVCSTPKRLYIVPSWRWLFLRCFQL